MSINSLNNQTMAKSMNGLNIINADQINTNNFNATTLTSTNLTTNNLTATGTITLPAGSIDDIDLTSNVALLNRNPQTFTGVNTFNNQTNFSSGISATNSQTISFGTNAPTMSGANIGNATIPDGALSSNIALLNRNPQTFTGANTFNDNITIVNGKRILVPNTNNNLWITNTNTTNWNTTTNSVVIGQACGASLNGSGSQLNTIVGVNNVQSASTNMNQTTAMGYSCLTNVAGAGSVGNSAFGAYAGMSMTTGSQTNGFFGTAVGNGLVTNCRDNFAMATDAMSNGYSQPLLMQYYSGSNITADTFTLLYSGGSVGKWATYLFVFVGSGAQSNTSYKVTCSEVNYTTNTLTFETNTWRLTTDTYLAIYERGAKISTTYLGSTATGTTFTIPTGLAITAGMRMSYMESSTLNKQATVSSYTSGTGVLVLTTTITLLGSSVIDFYNTTRLVGNNVSYNMAIGRGALQNVSTNSQFNTCSGTGALAGVQSGGAPTYDNNRFVCGTGNSCFGFGAGASCWGQPQYNTFIGYRCDAESPRLNFLTNCIGIGANVKLWKNNLINIGGDTIDKSLTINGLITYDNDGAQTINFNKVTTFNNGITASATQTINFGSNAPTMSGANIIAGSIPVSSIIKNTTALNTARVCFYAPNSNANIVNASYPLGTYDITLVGSFAGNNLDDSVSSFQAITCVGGNAYATATEGQEVVAIGGNAGGSVYKATSCIFIGSFSGGGATHFYSSFIGSDSGSAFTGNRFGNNCIGTSAYNATTTGDYNTGQGSGVGRANTTGSYNTAIGADAYGSAVGYVSQNSNNCVYIGARSGNGNTASITNSVAIGYNSQVLSSNTIQLGTSSETTNITGRFNINNATAGVDVLTIQKNGGGGYLYVNNTNNQIGFWNGSAHNWYINSNTGDLLLHQQYVNKGTYQNITAAWSTLDANSFFYSTYSFICNATTFIATLPTPSATNVGNEILFRRVGGTITTPVNCTPAIWIATGTTTTNTLVAGSAYIAKIRCIYITASTYAWSLV